MSFPCIVLSILMISHFSPTIALILSSSILAVIDIFKATFSFFFSGTITLTSNFSSSSFPKYHSCIGSRCNCCTSTLLISEKSTPKYINNGCGAIAYKYIFLFPSLFCNGLTFSKKHSFKLLASNLKKDSLFFSLYVFPLKSIIFPSLYIFCFRTLFLISSSGIIGILSEILDEYFTAIILLFLGIFINSLM